MTQSETPENKQDLMLRRQVNKVISDLDDTQLLKSNWATPLNSAPTAITLLGESIITSSMDRAHLIFLNGENIPNWPLPACLLKCSNIGLKCFVDAQLGMDSIRLNAMSVARGRGTIDKIVESIDREDSPKARAFLDRQLQSLKAAADLCSDKANTIKESFEKWEAFTEEILLAMGIKRAEMEEDQTKAAQKLKQNSERQDTIQKNIVEAGRKIDEAKKRTEKVAEQDNKKMGLGTKLKLGAGLLLTMANPIAGTAFLAGTILSAGSSSTTEELEMAKEYEERQIRAKEQAELEQKSILRDLILLQSEEGTLEQFKKVVARALMNLRSMQHQIAQLLLFVGNINNLVNELILKQHSEVVGNIEDSKGDWDFPDFICDDVREMALMLKGSLLAVATISSAYTEVSQKFILPGLEKIDKLVTTNVALTGEDVELKSKELRSTYTDVAVEKVKAITSSREIELRTTLHALLTNSESAKLIK